MQAPQAAAMLDVPELEVPRVAALAAVEADFLSRGKAADAANLKLLGGYLASGAASVKDSGWDIRHIENLSKVCLIVDALSALQGEPPTTFQDLHAQADSLAQDFQGVGDSHRQNKDVLCRLRDFCVALSNHAMAADWNFHEGYDPDDMKRGF